MGKDIFNSTNLLKVLSFLSENPGKEFLNSEIREATVLSRAGVYIALRELIRQKLIAQTEKGKTFFYSCIYNDPIVKQFKILKNVFDLRKPVSKLKPFSRKIVLYGSMSRGENDPTSDIDLFVVTNNPDEVKRKLSKFKSLNPKQRIQSVIRTPSELSEFKEKEKIFYSEIDRGIVLWEEMV